MNKIVENYKNYTKTLNNRWVGISKIINDQQDRLDYYRSFGITPDNQPKNSKYMLEMLKPGKIFIDFSDNYDYMLEFDTSWRSIYTFKMIDLKTKEYTGKTVDVQRGNLKNLRSVYGFKMIESLNESMAYMCNTCGERLEHEEYEDDPNRICSNCGDSNWVSENEYEMDESLIKNFDQFLNEAYVSKEKTKQVREDLKKLFPQYKFSVRREHYSSLYVTILSGPIQLLIDEEKGYKQVNEYYIDEYYQNMPEVRDFLKKVLEVINVGNWDRSDIMTDYFDVGFYIYLSIGKWDKPYVVKNN